MTMLSVRNWRERRRVHLSAKRIGAMVILITGLALACWIVLDRYRAAQTSQWLQHRLEPSYPAPTINGRREPPDPNTVGGPTPRYAWPNINTCVAAPQGRRVAVQDGTDLVVVDLENGSVRRLAKGGHPSWSPDGTCIAYLGEAAGKSVLVCK